MKNLAGDKNCDQTIENELTRCGIEIMRGDRSTREVPASITGRLGDFTFVRAWIYWVVSGNLPLAIAEGLYKSPVGKADIRVVGHCGCPEPRPWAEFTEKGLCITSYHIDSELGLYVFAETLKKNGLA